MPNRRKSEHLHRLAGTLRPDRHGRGLSAAGERPEASDQAAPGVGRPPRYFDADLRKLWRELATGAPWLTGSDRHALELACRALSALRTATSPAPALLSQVGRALDRIALSTSARGESVGVRERSRKPPRGSAWDDLQLRSASS